MARRRRAPWGTIWGNQANVDNGSLLGWGHYVGRPAPYGYRDPMEEDEGGGMGMRRGGRGGGMSYLPIRAMSMGGGDGGDELEMDIGSMSEEDFGLKRGGKAKKGRVHLVGEEGQELLVPRTDGGYQVIPNEATEPLLELLGEGERGNENPMRRRCGGGIVRRAMGGRMGISLGEYLAQGRAAYNNDTPGRRALIGPPVPRWGKGGVIEEHCGGGIVRRACGGKVKRHQGGGILDEWPDAQEQKAIEADQASRAARVDMAVANEARRQNVADAFRRTVTPTSGGLGTPDTTPQNAYNPQVVGQPTIWQRLPALSTTNYVAVSPDPFAASQPDVRPGRSLSLPAMPNVGTPETGPNTARAVTAGAPPPPVSPTTVSGVAGITPTATGTPIPPTAAAPPTGAAPTMARPIHVIRGTEQTWANPADTQTEYGTEREAMRGKGTPVQSLTAEMPGNLLHSDKQRANWMLAMARIRGQQASAAERAGWEQKFLMQDIANQAKLDQIQAAQEGRNMPPIHTTEGEITNEWNPQLRRYVPTEDFRRRKTIEEHRPAIGKLNTRESLLNYFSALPDNYTRSVVRGLLSEGQLAMLFSK